MVEWLGSGRPVHGLDHGPQVWPDLRPGAALRNTPMNAAALHKLLLITLAALGVAWLGASAHAAEDGEVTAARAAIARGAKLVDVRTPEEYAAGKLPGAVNIPLAEAEKSTTAFGPKDKPVVVYCGSGRRSAKVKAVLVAAGFTAVFDLGAMKNGQAEPKPQ